MSVGRGTVVLLDYPFSAGTGSKVRPALVVQNDRDNQRLVNTIVVMITSRIQRALSEPAQVLIDITAPEGRQSGLLMISAVNCANLFTVDQRQIIRTLGRLPPSLMSQVDVSLKTSLSLA